MVTENVLFFYVEKLFWTLLSKIVLGLFESQPIYVSLLTFFRNQKRRQSLKLILMLRLKSLTWVSKHTPD